MHVSARIRADERHRVDDLPLPKRAGREYPRPASTLRGGHGNATERTASFAGERFGQKL